MHLLISKECDACGGEYAIVVYPTEPTPEQIRENEDSLGGMFCIRSKVIPITLLERTTVEI